jgi:TrmH family RNA methyltransferase
VELISSTRNPRVIAAAELHQARRRRETGRTLLEGPHLLAEAVAAGAHIDVVFALDPTELDEFGGTITGDIVPVTEAVLGRLAGTEHPRGPIAVLAVAPPEALRARDTIVLVDIADPGNAGTIIRTAAAFGFQVAVAGSTVDPWAPKVLRAAAGGHFRTQVSTLGDPLAELAECGIAPLALMPGEHARLELLHTDGPVALLVGSEAHGLRADLVARADGRVTLPMPGRIESLNAAVAAAIAMYERVRPVV